MSAIDMERMLLPITPDAPCGADLSYDPLYLQMERIAPGTPEQQVGDTVVPAAEPNWKDLLDRCLALWARSRDLRVAVYLSLSLLKTEGLAGFRDGLKLINGLVERYWDGFFPALDPSDDNPALERLNILSALSPSAETYQDPLRFKQRLMEAPLAVSARVGRFSLRDMLIAAGELKPSRADEGRPIPDASVISAAFADMELDSLNGLRAILADTAAQLDLLHGKLSERAGDDRATDLTGLAACVKQMLRRVEEALSARGALRAEAMPSADPAAGGAAPPVRASGEIDTPQDVIRALDTICRYYDRHEPSSPVPLLLRRAQRLVGKSFVDIVKDMTPDAVKQLEWLGGKD